MNFVPFLLQFAEQKHPYPEYNQHSYTYLFQKAALFSTIACWSGALSWRIKQQKTVRQ